MGVLPQWEPVGCSFGGPEKKSEGVREKLLSCGLTFKDSNRWMDGLDVASKAVEGNSGLWSGRKEEFPHTEGKEFGKSD